MTWSQIPQVCLVLGVVGLVLAAAPTVIERINVHLAARHVRAEEQARQRAEMALLTSGAASIDQLRAMRARSADPPVVRQAIAAIEQEALAKARGRHRPEAAGPDAVSATGIMRALNTEADRLPAISRRAIRR